MGASISIPKESKKSSDYKGSIRVESAVYLKEYSLLIAFSDRTERVIDFGPALQKYAGGYYAKYLKPACFQNFHVENGNVVWGTDWDIIFPVQNLYKGKVT